MREFHSSHFLTLSGTPRQRGRIHGESLRQEIRGVLGSWKEALGQEIRSSPDQFIIQLVSQTNFTSAIVQWTPDLLEEVRGIAEGAGVEFIDIFAFQLLDEQWWFELERWPDREAADRCSSIGCRGEDGCSGLIAQNMDLHQFLDGFQVVLHIKDDCSGYENLVFSAAGLLALNGMSRSLGIVCNNLGQLNHSKDGLPVAYVLRGVLEKESFASAVSFLKSIRHASGQNYILGSHSQLIDLECSANQVVEYPAECCSWSVCHTNHPLANLDYCDSLKDQHPGGEDFGDFIGKREVDSRTRFEVLSDHLGAFAPGKVTQEDARVLLSSHDSELHPICRHPEADQGWMTVGTSIMTLGDTSKLAVCPGPPCSSVFVEFEINTDR